MIYSLQIHRDFRRRSVAAIDVEVERRTQGELNLRYIMTGAVEDVRLPIPDAPLRTNELWMHTCFEAFVRPDDGSGYAEFNLAPSTRWAAYLFNTYRTGMADADIVQPVIAARKDDGRFELRATIDVRRLLNFSDSAAWRVGLSAVIEDTDGGKSYWALAHPAGKPDFHHVDGFVLDLTVTERA